MCVMHAHQNVNKKKIELFLFSLYHIQFVVDNSPNCQMSFVDQPVDMCCHTTKLNTSHST